MPVTFNIRFPGQYFDAETGLHSNRFRYYDPSIGRYISADPIGQAGGINVYNYALNSPVNLFDPFGLTVTINSRAVHWTAGRGAHTSVNVTKSDGTSSTYSSYEADGKNEIRKNDPNDHGPGKDPVTSSVVVPPPPGMTQDEWDNAVEKAFEDKLSNPDLEDYEIFPDPGEDEGNCHTTTRRGLTEAGGGVPPGYNPPGLNPDLHPSPGR